MHTVMFWWAAALLSLGIVNVLSSARKDISGSDLLISLLGLIIVSTPFVWYVITFWPQMMGNPL